MGTLANLLIIGAGLGAIAYLSNAKEAASAKVPVPDDFDLEADPNRAEHRFAIVAAKSLHGRKNVFLGSARTRLRARREMGYYAESNADDVAAGKPPTFQGIHIVDTKRELKRLQSARKR